MILDTVEEWCNERLQHNQSLQIATDFCILGYIVPLHLPTTHAPGSFASLTVDPSKSFFNSHKKSYRIALFRQEFRIQRAMVHSKLAGALLILRGNGQHTGPATGLALNLPAIH